LGHLDLTARHSCLRMSVTAQAASGSGVYAKGSRVGFCIWWMFFSAVRVVCSSARQCSGEALQQPGSQAAQQLVQSTSRAAQSRSWFPGPERPHSGRRPPLLPRPRALLRFGVQVNYREGISRTAEVRYVHKKQSGGSGQFADIAVRFEPGEPGTGFEFRSDIKGGVVPKEYIPGVVKVRSTARRGSGACRRTLRLHGPLFFLVELGQMWGQLCCRGVLEWGRGRAGVGMQGGAVPGGCASIYGEGARWRRVGKWEQIPIGSRSVR
jgi:hypothetical protein